jgi:L-ascorbate metabolism protein UlaG (beta-lactamase superfamily)
MLMFLGIAQTYAQRVAPDVIESNEGPIIIQPILHGTLVLQWNGKTIYVDPYGGADAFQGIDAPDLILITDIHGDHTNLETLKGLNTEKATFIVPEAVAELLKKDYEKQLTIIKNGGMSVQGDIFINALPMYNLPEAMDSKHPRGRGNGYFINMAGKGIYISGDTEDINEMRELRGIDVAFVCMNLPYTMDINQAADAVLDFKPKIVYPYHYRGNPDISDTEAFKKLVNAKNPKIEVRLRNWYPN